MYTTLHVHVHTAAHTYIPVCQSHYFQHPVSLVSYTGTHSCTDEKMDMNSLYNHTALA